jgi:hypothetical protein
MEKIPFRHGSILPVSRHFRRAGNFVLLALFLCFMLAGTIPLAAQEVSGWFAKSSLASAYGSVRSDIESIASSLSSAGISDSLLASRLEEGARKHVPAELMLATLRADTSRAISVAASLRERGLLPQDKRKATSEVEQASILLRAGLTEGELGASLDAATERNGKNESAVSRAIAALSAVAAVQAKFGISETERRRLAIALVSSDVSDGSLDSVLATMEKSVAGGSSVSEALDAAVGRFAGSKRANTDSGKDGSGAGGSGAGSSSGAGPGEGAGSGTGSSGKPSGAGGSSGSHGSSGHGKSADGL